MAALQIIGLIGPVVFDNLRRLSIVICKAAGLTSRHPWEHGLTSVVGVHDAVEGRSDAMRIRSG
jgi:hypothetical protein